MTNLILLCESDKTLVCMCVCKLINYKITLNITLNNKMVVSDSFEKYKKIGKDIIGSHTRQC